MIPPRLDRVWPSQSCHCSTDFFWPICWLAPWLIVCWPTAPPTRTPVNNLKFEETELMRFIYLILALGLIDAAILLGGDLVLFVNAPSILIVVGCGFFFTMAAHGYGGLSNALSAACGTKTNSTKEASSHALVLLTLRNSFLGAGAVGTFIGLVQMLVSLDDPSSVGPSLAVALLTMTYGFILAELVVAPAMDRMLAHSNTTNHSDIQMAKSPMSLHLAMLFVVLGVFMALLYSMTGIN
ncbi:MAG TPA: hypothetical protein EYN06_03035 [Myxococcales bacterium]|nr:hypothetical protein [Myxococcales bacterium]